MGQISIRLHRTLKKMAAPGERPTKNRHGLVEMTSIEEFFKDELDPVHAVFTFVQHITSHFAEGVSQLPEMAVYAIPDLQDSLPHA
ncbi:MAG: hypothetical protein IH899_02920 [Planctomycetes bacterium]|nr:hypothetical protein [Planctomycetota bacterium]